MMLANDLTRREPNLIRIKSRKYSLLGIPGDFAGYYLPLLKFINVERALERGGMGPR
jgi:hypothetical protein